MAADRVTVTGSERTPAADERIGQIDPDAQAEVTVYLRPRGNLGPEPARVSRAEFAARHGAAEGDIEAVRAFAVDYRLAVGPVDVARRSVILSGRVGDLAEAFGVSLAVHRTGDGQLYRARGGPLTVPASLTDVVTGVFGLDERPQASTHYRLGPVGAGYSPDQIAAAYDYPPGTDGDGQAVALVELGGGFREADLVAYFSSLGLAVPAVTAVSVDGARNAPGSANGPDGEVMLDIEVVGAVAPKAAVVAYFAPNTDRGFLDAVTTALHDTTNRPAVISISWGGPESTWTGQAMQQMEQAFLDAAALGVTVTVAAGDNGSTDGLGDGRQHVDFPASAPHALACGGTRLVLSGGVPAGETVWGGIPGDGATGGGISEVFPLPSYQRSAQVPPSANPGGQVGRGVPDVAGNADPQTGYQVQVDGQQIVVGGTSAVAPLWAAAVARMNQALGRDLGDVHAALYTAVGGFTDITAGSNGAYQAGPGWDPCTGLGSPLVRTLLASLRQPPPA